MLTMYVVAVALILFLFLPAKLHGDCYPNEKSHNRRFMDTEALVETLGLKSCIFKSYISFSYLYSVMD